MKYSFKTNKTQRFGTSSFMLKYTFTTSLVEIRYQLQRVNKNKLLPLIIKI